MANAHRGEIDAVLDGKTFRLCLTLGALAELENAFNDEDMLALAGRFDGGRLSARDCVRLIGAGLRGAGYEISDEAVRAMRAENGAAGFVDIVARLLQATFGAGEAEDGPRRASAEEGAAGPFPGDVMAAGLGALALAPADFWAMTPRELAAALRWRFPALEAAPSKDELAALMMRFPDQ